MNWFVEYLKQDWLFLLALVLLLYLLYFRPHIHEKRRLKNPDNEIRVGDLVARHNGIAGRIVRIEKGKITIESGKEKERFTFEVEDLDTNFSAIRRNKEIWKELSLWQKILRVV